MLEKIETKNNSESNLSFPLTQEERKEIVFDGKNPLEIGHIGTPKEIEKARTEAKIRFEALKSGKNIDGKELNEAEKKRSEEIKTILGNEGFDNVKASSVLFLQEKGVDLSNHFLINKNNPNLSVLSASIVEGSDFEINFWGNQNTNYFVGAGDLLPPTIREITINGKIGKRAVHPRPGYYSEQGEYIPIFHGDAIKILKKWVLTPEELQQEENAKKSHFEYMRVQDSVDAGGKPLTNLAEDIALKKKIESQQFEYQSEFNAAGEFGIVDSSRPVKTLKDLNFSEASLLLQRVFGRGPGSDLLIKEAQGSAVAISRMICLAEHEGGLKFGRQNADPASGYNFGTFQIGGLGSTPETSLGKYKNCLKAGLKRGSIAISENKIDAAKNLEELGKLVGGAGQCDLLAHIGYMNTQRPDSVFTDLRDASLSKTQLVKLMSTDIQGGIDDIGRHVYKLMENKKVSV